MIAVLRPIEGSAVHEDRIIGARLRTRVGHMALFVALAVVPVFAFNALATGASASNGGSDPTAGARPGLTDEQHQCLADHGVTLPFPSRHADQLRLLALSPSRVADPRRRTTSVQAVPSR